MNIFETMQTTLNGKSISDEEISKIPSYIFCKWLSGNKYTILASNEINKFYNIPIECQYKMIKSAFQGKIKFIKFPKNSKDLTQDIEKISKYYNVSIEKAKMYLEFISDEELNLIKKLK